MAAAAPNIEKSSRSHGEVPRRLSKYLHRNTPMSTHAAIVTPICEKKDKARKSSLPCLLPFSRGFFNRPPLSQAEMDPYV